MRSMLFCPADNGKLVKKAATSSADCIVLDLEDAIPEKNKKNARTKCRNYLESAPFANRNVLVRFNPPESGYTLEDIDTVACENLNGFVYPKANKAEDIFAFDSLLKKKEEELGLVTGHFMLIVLMETPESIFNALEIAQASSRIKGLLFGCEDFLAEMEGDHGPDGRSILVPRHLVSMACRAAGIKPIDTPYVKVHDYDGLRDHIHQARELGYEGMLVLTPKQLEIAHELYTPSIKEVAASEEMVELSEKAAEKGHGIIVSNDVFVSPPTLKRAQKILKRYNTIKKQRS